MQQQIPKRMLQRKKKKGRLLSGDVLFSLYDKNFLHDIMSTKEKQATPKAAFVFLVPLANEQPA